MELAQYLICFTTRHEQAKEIHEEEMREVWQARKRKKNERKTVSLTYQDEQDLLNTVIGSVGRRPVCLKKLSMPALGCLAYLFKAKMDNDCFTEGHEIVSRLVCNPERTIDYLQGLEELKELGWILMLSTPSSAFTDQPPFCWLQTPVELGSTFHEQMGTAQSIDRSFTSNDNYLDELFNYLQTVARDDGLLYKVHQADTDIAVAQPHDWYRRIMRRVECTTIPLPAADALKEYSLSVYQYLCLVGLLGKRDGDLHYDFTETADVIQIFSNGRICRKRMKEHLFGEKSPLMHKKLIESIDGSFGESIQITQLGSTALLGKHEGKLTEKELKARFKRTLFDYEEPEVKKESVMLPAPIMEAIRSIIFSESQLGQRIRKKWHTSLPAAWGSPTGSTVLLYGPPGTGKTLTAQYLASEMKLPLLKIDAAKILSCWFGQTEQKIRQIFDNYDMVKAQLGRSPLLLLNEADQLLGTRGGDDSAVGKTLSNMQNLFLEGLERFSGILVATTNRRELLDDAFSRRFTYKLELPPPDKNLRVELWKSHLPLKQLAADVDISQLADLGLSGGEIRLVVERAVRLAAFRGSTKLTHATLLTIAQEELACRMKQNGIKNRIGF